VKHRRLLGVTFVEDPRDGSGPEIVSSNPPMDDEEFWKKQAQKLYEMDKRPLIDDHGKKYYVLQRPEAIDRRIYL